MLIQHLIFITKKDSLYLPVSKMYLSFFLVYKDDGFGYLAIVSEHTHKSMADARREVQETPNYIANGDVSLPIHDKCDVWYAIS